MGLFRVRLWGLFGYRPVAIRSVLTSRGTCPTQVRLVKGGRAKVVSFGEAWPPSPVWLEFPQALGKGEK